MVVSSNNKKNRLNSEGSVGNWQHLHLRKEYNDIHKLKYMFKGGFGKHGNMRLLFQEIKLSQENY